MKHCGSVRSHPTLAVGARTPENLKIDLSSPSRSSLDSFLRRTVRLRFLIKPAWAAHALPGDASQIVAEPVACHGRVKQFV